MIWLALRYRRPQQQSHLRWSPLNGSKGIKVKHYYYRLIIKWICKYRGLHFVYLLLDDLVHSYEQKIGEKELVVVCQDAYEISLKNYHNWMIQKLAVACVSVNVLISCTDSRFSLCLYFLKIRTVCPHRKDFIQSLQNGTAGQSEEMLFQRMKRFVNGLEVNLQIIFLLYVDTGLDTVSSLKWISVILLSVRSLKSTTSRSLNLSIYVSPTK